VASADGGENLKLCKHSSRKEKYIIFSDI